MGQRNACDLTAHFSIIAGSLKPSSIRFIPSPDTTIPSYLVFTKGYIVTDSARLGSAYIDVEIPLEHIISKTERGEMETGSCVTVSLRAYWREYLRLNDASIPLKRTEKYYTTDGLFCGLQYLWRAIKSPVLYILHGDDDPGWGFRKTETEILREWRGVVRAESDDTLVVGSVKDCKTIQDLTAAPLVCANGFNTDYSMEDIEPEAILDQVSVLGLGSESCEVLDVLRENLKTG